MSIVDRIREQLNRDGVPAEEMEPLAMEYAVEVERVNQRLMECSMLLRRGLRSEAIQKANMRPNVLEWAARLDFPEIDEWVEILKFFELPVPKQLNRLMVQQLHEAIVEEQPLEQLLKQHRRLAIAKAPLAWRLRVLRQIAQVDSLNPVWNEDLETWEKARLAEIPSELQTAKAAADFHACSQLAAELTRFNWIVSLPEPLVEASRNAANELEYANQCEELSDIGQSLYDAFCSHDEVLGRQHRANWMALVQMMRQSPPPDLSDLVEPALLWLENVDAHELELESHRQAVVDLERELSNPKTILGVQNAHQLATRSGHELEPRLQKRYESVIAELQLSNQRKSFLRIASIASAAVLLLGVFVIWQRRSLRAAEIMSSVTSIEGMLTKGQLQEAQKFVENLSAKKAYVLDSAQIQSLLSDLENRQAAEQQRVREFESFMALLESTPAEQIDLGIVKKAEELARTEHEKGRVFKVRRAKQAYDSKLETEQLTAVQREVQRLSRELDRLESLPLESLNQNSFDPILAELSKLRQDNPRAGSAGIDLITNLWTRTTNQRKVVRDAISVNQIKAEAQNRIRSAQSLQDHHQALEAYISTVNDAVSKREYTEALTESELWKIVERWNRLCAQARSFIGKWSPDEARELHTALAAFQQEIDIRPSFAGISSAMECIDRIQRRPDEFERLKKSLSDSILSTLYTLHLSVHGEPEIKRYFAYGRDVDGNPVFKKQFNLATIEIVSETNGAVKKVSAKFPNEMIKQPKTFFDTLAASLSTKKNDVLRQWEIELLGFAKQTLDESQLDSSAKEAILSIIVDAAIMGSSYLDERLEPISLELKQRQKLKPWADPVKPSYKIEQEFLGKLKRVLGDAHREQAASGEAVRALSAASIQWVGSLQRDSEGRILPWLARQPTRNGQLLVVVKNPSSQTSAEIVPIANYRDSESTMIPSTASLLAGRPLFFIAQP